MEKRQKKAIGLYAAYVATALVTYIGYVVLNHKLVNGK